MWQVNLRLINNKSPGVNQKLKKLQLLFVSNIEIFCENKTQDPMCQHQEEAILHFLLSSGQTFFSIELSRQL